MRRFDFDVRTKVMQRNAQILVMEHRRGVRCRRRIIRVGVRNAQWQADKAREDLNDGIDIRAISHARLWVRMKLCSGFWNTLPRPSTVSANPTSCFHGRRPVHTENCSEMSGETYLKHAASEVVQTLLCGPPLGGKGEHHCQNQVAAAFPQSKFIYRRLRRKSERPSNQPTQSDVDPTTRLRARIRFDECRAVGPRGTAGRDGKFTFCQDW